eukprot:15290-Heterococcus_DN1.PRE.2
MQCVGALHSHYAAVHACSALASVTAAAAIAITVTAAVAGMPALTSRTNTAASSRNLVHSKVAYKQQGLGLASNAIDACDSG